MKKTKMKSKALRTLTAIAFIAIVVAGVAVHTGLGTASAFGVYDIAAICPVGAIEVVLASKTVVPPLLIGLGIAVAITLVVGRAFCSWGCPVPLVRRLFGIRAKGEKGDNAVRARSQGKADLFQGGSSDEAASSGRVPEAPSASPRVWAETAGERAGAKRGSLPARLSRKLDVEPQKRGGAQDSRNWVLGGALVATAAFGFPVFCLVCPVGLTFATVIALCRLLQMNEATLSLIVFPALLIVELLAMRKWCHHFCPIGALLSLIARGNRTFRPQSDPVACIKTSKGRECDACARACPEGIDLHDRLHSAPLNECVKCRSCADVCPASAITFPLFQKKVEDLEVEALDSSGSHGAD